MPSRLSLELQLIWMQKCAILGFMFCKERSILRDLDVAVVFSGEFLKSKEFCNCNLKSVLHSLLLVQLDLVSLLYGLF